MKLKYPVSAVLLVLSIVLFFFMKQITIVPSVLLFICFIAIQYAWKEEVKEGMERIQAERPPSAEIIPISQVQQL